jgi:cation:H+ antiporter
MSSLLLYIAGFLACSFLIVFSGARLSRYGDAIAEQTGMGKAWLGLILMAAITSLPEMVTGISALTILNVPDIAVGDIMGSCAFNLLILAVLDYFVPGRPLSSVVTKGHVMAGFLGMFLLTMAVIGLVFGPVFPVWGAVSSLSVLMMVMYLAAVWIIFQNEKHHPPAVPAQRPAAAAVPLKVAVRRYVLAAFFVVAAAVALPFFAEHLAGLLGLNQSFVGTLLVAATTSLPELVVSIAAVRLGSVDIAVGNLLGSNIFNMLILAVDDVLYRKGPLLQAVDGNHALSALVALLMTAVAGVGILYSKPHKRFWLGADAVVLVVLYLLLMIALFNLSKA